MFHAVIMAGGGGTRFWPRSRTRKPKQFLNFQGERTLLQSTFDRLESLAPADKFWVITGAAHREQAVEQLPGLPAANVVGEPAGRDTAACVALGAALVFKRDPNAVMVLSPADHVIEPEREFQRAIAAAVQIANEYPSALVTFGIPPSYPATGYGYIHRGELIARRCGVPAYRVEQFREKPSGDLAEQFLASGEYLWNSGIFVWRASAIRAELERQQPKLFAAVEQIADAWGTPEQDKVFAEVYPAVEKISIDYAVMEHAKDVFVLEAPYQWDDVGSWLALERRNPQDAQGNTVRAAHCGIETTNCVIAAEPGKLIATIGVSNLLIIQDGDCTLVADRRDEAAVKQLVDKLKALGLEKYL